MGASAEMSGKLITHPKRVQPRGVLSLFCCVLLFACSLRLHFFSQFLFSLQSKRNGEEREIGLIGLVAWFGSLPLLRSSAAAAAPNPQQESKPNQTKPIHSHAASAVNSLFLHQLAHSEERAEREKGIEWRAAYPTGLH